MENCIFHKLMCLGDAHSKNIIKLYALKYTFMCTQVWVRSVQKNVGGCC